MWDDGGNLKFVPEDFRTFNQDTVVLLGWRRRREWIVGGDRATFWDPYCYWENDPVRADVVLSHFGKAQGVVNVAWRVGFPNEPPFEQGEVGNELVAPGSVGQLGLIQFSAPDVSIPRRADLHVRVQMEQTVSENFWRFYFFPRAAWGELRPITLLDSLWRLPKLNDFVDCHSTLSFERVGVFTLWTDEIARFIAAGGCGVLLLDHDGLPSPVDKVARPFWREALKVAVPHLAWGDFPEPDDPYVQFNGMAPDVALDTAAWGAQARPIFRRVDTRRIEVHDYAAELLIGKGRLLVTTLRLDGRLGNQPSGLAYHPAAVHLLTCWLRYLQNR
jgi:hypothetical protein